MTEVQKPAERVSMRFCVCYRCGKGPHEKETLYKVGIAQDGQTVYGCQAHRGLIGNVEKKGDWNV